MKLLLASLLVFAPLTVHADEVSSVPLGPVAQSCLDDPPSANDAFMVSLCAGFAAIELEERTHREAPAHIDTQPCDAVCRYPADKLRENRAAIETGKLKAAQWAQSARSPRMPSLEELDRDIAILESRMARPMPPMPMMLSFTSYSLGMFVNTDCY
jgi:hypothetical protein